jgi:hypothetical protein
MDNKKFVQVEVMPIEEAATMDLMNTNKHTQRGRGREENSLRKRGVFRPIAAAGKGVTVPVIGAGNQTFEIAANIGIKEAIVVHTRGDQIIINVRDDVAPNSPEFYALAIEDNATVDFNPDIEILAAVMADPAMQALKAEDKMLADIVEGMGKEVFSADVLEGFGAIVENELSANSSVTLVFPKEAAELVRARIKKDTAPIFAKRVLTLVGD